jgi:ribulose-phosphate 3-epimerase
MSIKIAPSILSSDFGRLAEQVVEASEAGADWIHVDVMDGHFVPNITIGPAVTAAIRKVSDLPLDVHLMIEKPERHIDAFADAGADFLTVHQEVCRDLRSTLEQIRKLNVRPGVTLNPATPVDTLTDVVPYADLVLVMSVHPGFGGQSYISSSTNKIAHLRKILDENGLDAELEVDGGVDGETAKIVADAGATVLVAGSFVYHHPDGIGEAIRTLRESARG